MSDAAYYRTVVITVSDKGFRGEREDKSGPAIIEILEGSACKVIKSFLLPDDKEMLKQTMTEICDKNEADLILTTGGTGFSVRDVTPEATEEVCERMAPGIPEALRYYSMQITPRAMLSRQTAGIRKRTLIINMPGSPKACRENLDYLLPSLSHGLDILTGRDGECGR